MNRGVFQSSPVQQMVPGSPNWWSINNMRPPSHSHQQHTLLAPPPNCFPHYTPNPGSDDNQELPESWSQLLLGGLVEEEDKPCLSNMLQQGKKLDCWEEQMLNQNLNSSSVDVKQEKSANGYHFCAGGSEFQAAKPACWSQMMPVSSPNSCVTNISSNMLDFSSKSEGKHPQADPSSGCNTTTTVRAAKKAKIQASSVQSTFKVRKEKLGDRITALHQIVSPFGKTDTASVLLEAIGYIRFLQNQIEALSLPYLGSGSGNIRQKNHVQGQRNSFFPEDPGQMSNGNSTKRKGVPDQETSEEPNKDLRSRGLCLVPISCTLHVGNEIGADYWAPAMDANFR